MSSEYKNAEKVASSVAAADPNELSFSQAFGDADVPKTKTAAKKKVATAKTTTTNATTTNNNNNNKVKKISQTNLICAKTQWGNPILSKGVLTNVPLTYVGRASILTHDSNERRKLLFKALAALTTLRLVTHREHENEERSDEYYASSLRSSFPLFAPHRSLSVPLSLL